jgi:hypothetical protein
VLDADGSASPEGAHATGGGGGRIGEPAVRASSGRLCLLRPACSKRAIKHPSFIAKVNYWVSNAVKSIARIPIVADRFEEGAHFLVGGYVPGFGLRQIS